MRIEYYIILYIAIALFIGYVIMPFVQIVILKNSKEEYLKNRDMVTELVASFMFPLLPFFLANVIVASLFNGTWRALLAFIFIKIKLFILSVAARNIITNINKNNLELTYRDAQCRFCGQSIKNDRPRI